MLTLTPLRTGTVAEVRVDGVLDLSTAHLLTALVEELTTGDDTPSEVILDLADVALLCAAGVTALLKAQRRIAASSGRLILRNPSQISRKVLDITDTARHFHIRVSGEHLS